jgi:hypothetical protein
VYCRCSTPRRRQDRHRHGPDLGVTVTMVTGDALEIAKKTVKALAETGIAA